MHANAYPEDRDGINTKVVIPDLKSPTSDTKSPIPESKAPAPDSNIPAPAPNSTASDSKSSRRRRNRFRLPNPFDLW